MSSPEDARRVGELLKLRRDELGLRRSEVARRVGISPTYVAMIEDARPREGGRGSPSRPTADILLAWSSALALGEPQTEELLAAAGYAAPRAVAEFRQLTAAEPLPQSAE